MQRVVPADPGQDRRVHAGIFQAEPDAGRELFRYLNAPGQVKEEELQWRLGFPVAADSAVAAPLLKGECKATKIAVYLYVGPYDKVGAAYVKIFEFLAKSGFKAVGPTMEKYLDMDPMAVKPEELRTEINIPVVKKSEK
jgi:predicted transcriptional regulator YdeE